MHTSPLPPRPGRRDRSGRALTRLLFFPVVAIACAALPASAQEPSESGGSADPALRAHGDVGEWGGPLALQLVARARDVRTAQQVDSTFLNYQSRADAYVYFYIDRPDEEERTLIKADQIALDVFWRAPDDTRQRIVGRRDEQALPTNIKYHLDHLTVVQDEFGDVIRIGDGDEVAAVIHPVAPGGPAHYEYRLGDSLTIGFGGAREPVRVQEVEVRPRDTATPGFVGSVYIDRATASIVRMTFTFTAASYVDPYLDYIRISLDNALWMDRWWLPYRQELEVRREMPVIDFLAGSVIRGRFEVSDYQFNQDLPELLFTGPGVTQVSPERLEAFPFERSLYADLDERGLAATDEIELLEQQVREMGVETTLGGLNPLRLYWASFSDGLSYNRMEGWVAGLGTSFDLGDSRLRVLGAHAFGPGEWQGRAELSRELLGGRARAVVRANRSRDVGPFPGAPGFFNTLATLAGSDFSDMYRVSGVELGWRGELGDRPTDLRLRVEDERQRAIAVDDPAQYRSAPPVGAGRRVEVAASTEWRTEWGGSLRLAGTLARFDPLIRDYDPLFTGSLEGRARWSTDPFATGPGGHVAISVGSRFGDLLAQDVYWLGGRGSLPGFDFRDRSGSGYVLVDGEIGTVIAPTWLSAHLFAATGWTPSWRNGADRPIDFSPDREMRALDAPDGWRLSLGGGVELFWEVVRLDVAHGVPDGKWEVIVSVRPDLAGWM